MEHSALFAMLAADAYASLDFFAAPISTVPSTANTRMKSGMKASTTSATRQPLMNPIMSPAMNVVTY